MLALLILFIGSKAAGNLSLAWGTKHLPQHLAANPVHYFGAFLNPFVSAGILMMILSLLTRMALLSVADLSFILPMTSIGYVVSAVLGVTFLGEKVTPAAWLGTLLIFTGAVVVGSTPRVAVQNSPEND